MPLACCPWGDPEVLVGWPSAETCSFSRLCRPIMRLTYVNMKRSRRIIQLSGPLQIKRRLGRKSFTGHCSQTGALLLSFEGS